MGMQLSWFGVGLLSCWCRFSSRCGKRFFSHSWLSVQALSWCLYNSCAITCINICVHFNEPCGPCISQSSVRHFHEWSWIAVAFPCFTVVKSFMSWYNLLLLFFLIFLQSHYTILSILLPFFLCVCASWCCSSPCIYQILQVGIFSFSLQFFYHTDQEFLQWPVVCFLGFFLRCLSRISLAVSGHSSSLAKIILQGTVKGGRKQGRQKKRWEDNIRQWTDLGFTKSQRSVENREKWRKLAVKSSVVPQLPSRLRNGWRWRVTNQPYKIGLKQNQGAVFLLCYASKHARKILLQNCLHDLSIYSQLEISKLDVTIQL